MLISIEIVVLQLPPSTPHIHCSYPNKIALNWVRIALSTQLRPLNKFKKITIFEYSHLI